MSCDEMNRTAPRYRLERNMYAFFILGRDLIFQYDARVQGLFAGHISVMQEVNEVIEDIEDYQGSWRNWR